MQSNTSAPARNLKIDGMSGDVCVKKVTEALKGTQGVTTQSVKVGSATILADQNACDAACAGIKKAGFTAHEDSSTQNKSGNQSPMEQSCSTPATAGKDMNSHGDTSSDSTKPAAAHVPVAH